MITQPLATTIAGLMYAVLGYAKNSRDGHKFKMKKTLTTVSISCAIGLLMAVYGVSTGNVATDGGLAIGLGSLVKKSFQFVWKCRHGCKKRGRPFKIVTRA